MGRRLTAFDIAADGTLSNRRVWAELGDATPDGICLDAGRRDLGRDAHERRSASASSKGGEVTDRIPTSQGCFACMLGGADGRTLHLITGQLTGNIDRLVAEPPGRVETVRVDVRGAGRP